MIIVCHSGYRLEYTVRFVKSCLVLRDYKIRDIPSTIYSFLNKFLSYSSLLDRSIHFLVKLHISAGNAFTTDQNWDQDLPAWVGSLQRHAPFTREFRSGIFQKSVSNQNKSPYQRKISDYRRSRLVCHYYWLQRWIGV